MLDRGGVERADDLDEHRFARTAILGDHAHLDEPVGLERDIDLVHHGRCEAVLSDDHDRMQSMGFRAKLAALLRCQLDHRPSVTRRL